MTVLALDRGAFDRDIADSRRTTRWTMTTSVVAHVLLLLLVMLVKSEPPDRPMITEITLIDPGTLGAPAAAAPTAPVSAPAPITAGKIERRFERLRTRSELAPEPQVRGAATDQIAARLASLQQSAVAQVAGVASTPTPSASWGAPATIPGPGGGGRTPMALNRSGGGGAPLPLQRGGSGGHALAPALAATRLPADRAEATAPARGGDAASRRSLAGASLAGPIADRPILSFITPPYPEWAKRDAVEGSVTLYFIVRPDGSVKENVLVQKTAGFEDFDENARTALRGWRFEPLRRGRTGEQWGTITFHYRLAGG